MKLLRFQCELISFNLLDFLAQKKYNFQTVLNFKKVLCEDPPTNLLHHIIQPYCEPRQASYNLNLL